MTTTLSKEQCKNLYSWWWDSHIPKNSKWLQDNLADMDTNVKFMIQLIEEDADSFAQRAEMFYQKRPELMKLIEEFYRAYRALAERYDHASGAIRQAHKTMSEVFPNQIPFEVSSPRSGCSTPPLFDYDPTTLSTPVVGWRNEARKLLDFIEDEEGNDSSELLVENQNSKIRIVDELELNVKSEDELQILQRIYSKLKSEKEEALQQFRHSLSQITSLEAEIESFQMQNSKLTVENIRLQTMEESYRLLEKEKKSILSESGILEKKAIKQNDQLSAMQEELEKLKLSLKDENLRCLHAEAALLSLENLYSQSVEALRISELKIEMRERLLKETEVEKKSLEEQVGRFKNEIRGLNDLNISSKNMIMEMEIEISWLKEEKKKVEAKVDNHRGLKKIIEEELSCLKEEIDYLRNYNRNAKKQIKAIGLNEEFLRESVKELLVSNIELRDVCKKIEDGNLLLSERVTRMNEIKEKNVELKVSVSDGNIELENLRLKIEELEKSHEFLCNKNSSLESENVTLVSMVENVKGENAIMTKKNGDLENFLSEAIVELEGLRGNQKSLSESYKILANEKSQLQIQRNTLITQVEFMGNNLEDLGSRHAELQDLYFNVEKRKEAKETQLAELQNLHKIQRQDHELFTDFISARLISLEEEIRRLVKEGEFRDEQYENKQCNIFAAELEIFVIRRFLDDFKDENRNILKEVWRTEACILRQKEKEVVLLNQIERLKKVIHHVWSAVNTEDGNCDVMVITNGSEDLYERYISDKIKLLQNSIRDIKVEKQSLQKEKSIFVGLLEQLGHQVTDLRSEKNDLYRDFKNKSEEVSNLQSEKERILEMNVKLMEASVVCCAKEENMNLEAENLNRRVSDLQVAYSVSQDENRKLVEENGDLSTRFCVLMEDVRLLEEEYTAILSKAMALDSLTVFFQQFEKQEIEDLKILEDELNLSRKTSADLEIKTVEMINKIGSIEVENSIFKNLVSLKLEEYRDYLTILSVDMSIVRTLNEDLSDQIRQIYQLIENKNSLLARKDSALLESNQNFQCLKNQNECLHENLKNVISELDRLEKKVMDKDKDIALASQSNKILHDKIQRLEGENKSLRNIKKDLKESYEEEFTVMCMQAADVNAVLFQGKGGELMEACEDLKTRNMAQREDSIKELSLKDAQIRDVNEQLKDSVVENQEMKSELNEYASVISALDDNILALKDSIKFIHPSSSSDHLQVQGEESENPKRYHKATHGIGIVELRRVLYKVESLREALEDSRYHMPSEKFRNSTLYPRKSTSQDMKDIPLDHISRPNNYDLVDNDQMLHLWEEHEHKTAKNHDVKDESKSEEYSCSEKELAEVEVENFIQDWNKEVVERLCFDAGKLSNLQEDAFLLKTKIMDLENGKFPKSFEFETIKVQLRGTESRIIQSVETNRKLIKRARDCSQSTKATENDGSDKQTKKQEWSNKRKQVLERMGRLSDRIGRLELDLHKYQYVLLKLEEEYDNYRSKVVPAEKKYSVHLKDYLYGGEKRKSRRLVTNGQSRGWCI